MKGRKEIFYANSNQKRAGVALLDKIDFKFKNVTRNYCKKDMLIKDSIQQEDITIINIYIPNDRPSKCMKQTLTELKGEIDSSTI